MADNLNYDVANSSCKNNSADSCAKYGRRYMWSGAMDSVGIFSTNGLGCGNGLTCSPDYPVRGICPLGWHLPNLSERDSLIEWLREMGTQADDLGTLLHFERDVYFWTSEEKDDNSARYMMAGKDYFCALESCTSNKDAVRSVRCVKGKNAEQDLSKFSSSSSSVQSSSSSSSLSSGIRYFSEGEMTDERDGQVYKTFTMEVRFSGSPITPRQTWMVEYLRYAYLQPTAELDSSSFCMDNKPEYCGKYGRMYLWSAAVDSAALFSDDAKGCGYFEMRAEWLRCPNESGKYVRGVCPKGWHVPIFSEYREMYRYLADSPEVDGYSPVVPDAVYYDSEFKLFASSSATWWLSSDVGYDEAYASGYYPFDMCEGCDSISRVVYRSSKRNALPVLCVEDIPD